MPATIKIADLDVAIKNSLKNLKAANGLPFSPSTKVPPLINGIIVDQASLGGALPMTYARNVHKGLAEEIKAATLPKALDLGNGKILIGLIVKSELTIR